MTMLMLSVKMEIKGQKSSSGHQQQNTRLCADTIPVGRAGVGKTTSKAREVQIPSNLEGRRDYHTEATSVVTKKGQIINRTMLAHTFFSGVTWERGFFLFW